MVIVAMTTQVTEADLGCNLNLATEVAKAKPGCNLNKLVSKCSRALYDFMLKPSLKCCKEIKKAIEDDKKCMCKYLYSNCGDKFPGLLETVLVCKANISCFK